MNGVRGKNGDELSVSEPSAVRVAAGSGDVLLRVPNALTLRNAAVFCRAVQRHLEAGARGLSLDLEEVKATDVVGLAALLQSVRLATLLGVRTAVLPSPAVFRALVDVEILDEIPHLAGPNPAAPSSDLAVVCRPDDPVPFVAQNERLGLRQPAWEELALFKRWAQDAFLDQMVGSELLYFCRHLGPYHPDFVSLVLNDATSVTLVVQPVGARSSPVGYVRLYGIRLVEQIAFLEIAVADLRFLRRGWGIEAARLLLAYAVDTLGIRRVEAKVYAYNVLSANSLRRNGFQQEGVLREAKTCDGRRWDILVFSILAEEMAEERRRERFPYMGFWA
jgi:anti-anti-sigma regulatory factor